MSSIIRKTLVSIFSSKEQEKLNDARFLGSYIENHFSSKAIEDIKLEVKKTSDGINFIIDELESDSENEANIALRISEFDEIIISITCVASIIQNGRVISIDPEFLDDDEDQ
ncbi:MAG: hypothetical protein AAF626_14015 [Pseudomonadota bacterium]